MQKWEQLTTKYGQAVTEQLYVHLLTGRIETVT